MNLRNVIKEPDTEQIKVDSVSGVVLLLRVPNQSSEFLLSNDISEQHNITEIVNMENRTRG